MSILTHPGAAAGQALRDTNVDLVERYKPAWTRRIQRAFVGYLEAHQEGTTDDVRPLAAIPNEAGPAVFGAATIGLARAKIIRKIGYRVSTRPERHACEIKVWTLVDRHAARRWLDTHPELDEVDASVKGPRESEAPRGPSLDYLMLDSI